MVVRLYLGFKSPPLRSFTNLTAMKIKAKNPAKTDFKKDKLQHNYFDIMINENGDIHIEPWDAVLDEIFVNKNKKILNKDIKIYRYCG